MNDAAQRLATTFSRRVRAWTHDALPADLRDAVAQLAHAASLATAHGDVCIALAEHGDAASLRAALLASGTCGTHDAPGNLPLVLDAEGRLYLHRYFDHERRLAGRLARAAVDAGPVGDAALAELRALQLGADAVDWQQLAAALALKRRLLVVSGGPGTGKTTAVVRLLACLLAQDPACRIALAAPTGKAAARMTDALRERAAQLPAALRAQLPTEATTIHRLLGATPQGFRHDAANPLAVDVLVVDEASMLDLALAATLLDAVPDTARIVLLGDQHQLAAVEAGAVFAELSADPSLSAPCGRELSRWLGVPADALVAPKPERASPLRDSTVWLQRNWRFASDSGIGRLAADIRAGRADAALARLRPDAANDAQLRRIDDAGREPGAATLAALHDGYAAYLDAVQRAPRERAGALAAFDAFRALAAVNDGPRGVDALNDAMTRHARERLGVHDGAAWYLGRPVIVLRNDPVLRLYNGDVGLALPADDGDELLVWFADGARATLRAFAPARLPEHRSAWATSVHKAQGSEFDAVLLLLPRQAGAVTTRELLYTAVTRARRHVTLAAGDDVLRAAIDAPTRRRSGLIARLAEALG